MKKRRRPSTIEMKTISGKVVTILRRPYTALLKKLADQGAEYILLHIEASGKVILSYKVGNTVGRAEFKQLGG